MKRFLVLIMVLFIASTAHGQYSQSEIANKEWAIDGTNIARATSTGKTLVRLSGHNHSLAGTSEVIGHGSSTQGYVLRGTILAVKCASANDDTAGTGLRSLLITGLDSSFAAQSETIILAGSGIGDSVLTTNKYVRLFSAIAQTGGSNSVAAGAITITSSHAGADTTLLTITTGETCSHSAIYTVPAGKTLYVKELYASSAAGVLQTITLVSRVRITDESYRPWQEDVGGQVWLSTWQLPMILPWEYEEYTDIEMRGIGNTGNVIAGLSGWIE